MTVQATARITGLKEFKFKMKAAETVARRGLAQGLVLGGLHLQRESQKLVPVDTGTLKNSAFTRLETSAGGDPLVKVGYTTGYGVYVHEAPMKLKGLKRKPRYIDGVKVGGKGNYWDPQGRASNKFLEKPFRTERKTVVEYVRQAVRKALGSLGTTK